MHNALLPRTLQITVATAALAVTLSACGGGGTHTSSGGSSTTEGGAAGATGSNGNGRFPGTSGSVAAISGSSMEVQNQQTGQVTVNWTSSTNFSESATVSAAGVAAGDCVTVIGSNSTGTLSARTVMINRPDTSGTCASNSFGRPSGGGGGGFPGGAPPNGGSVPNPPSGSFPGGGSGFAFASGKVTSISSTSLVLFGTSSSGFAGNAGQGSTPPTSIKATSVTVALGSSTRYTENRTVPAASLAVGDCVTANGSTDSTGAVTARTVRITSTGGQSCSSGFAPPGASNNG